jgi:hypothetical protein
MSQPITVAAWSWTFDPSPVNDAGCAWFMFDAAQTEPCEGTDPTLVLGASEHCTSQTPTSSTSTQVLYIAVCLGGNT